MRGVTTQCLACNINADGSYKYSNTYVGCAFTVGDAPVGQSTNIGDTPSTSDYSGGGYTCAFCGGYKSSFYADESDILSGMWSPGIKLDDDPGSHPGYTDDYFGYVSPFHTILTTSDAVTDTYSTTYPAGFHSYILDIPSHEVKFGEIIGQEIYYSQNHSSPISAIMTDDWSPPTYEYYWGEGALYYYTTYCEEITNVCHSLDVLHFINSGFDMGVPSGYLYDDMNTELEELDSYDGLFTDTYAPDGIIMENPFNTYWLDTLEKRIEAYNWFDYWCHDCGITLVFLQKPSDADFPYNYDMGAQFCAALAMQLNGPFVGVGCRPDWNEMEDDGSNDYWWNWPAEFGTQTSRTGPDEYGYCSSTYSSGWTLHIDLNGQGYYWDQE